MKDLKGFESLKMGNGETESYSTQEDYIKLQSKWFNEEEGELNKEDGIDCPICKNKGHISYVENGIEYIKDCKCMIKRKTYFRILNCGLSKDALENYTMKNWKTNEEWQKSLLQKCRDYFLDVRDKKGHWFILSGMSGCGKTHLCTALFKELVYTFCLSGFYMLWNEEMPKLASMRKSSASENQEKYEKRLNELKNCDILYIDDLFKLDSRNKDDSISICYEILNYRYINNKLTMISTEIERKQFENIDTAIWGRIFEKSGKGLFWLTITGEDKNFRAKG